MAKLKSVSPTWSTWPNNSNHNTMLIYSTTAKTTDEQKRKIARANDMRKAGYSQDLIERRVKATYRTLRLWADKHKLLLLP